MSKSSNLAVLGSSSNQPQAPTNLSSFEPETVGFGYDHGDRYQNEFSPIAADYYAHPISNPSTIDYRSNNAPEKVCVPVHQGGGVVKTLCSKCFDCSNGRGPTVPCQLGTVEPFDPVPMVKYFIKLLTIPSYLTAKEKNERWSKAFALLHPKMQEGWGGPRGMQGKIYDPRSPFAPLGRARQIYIDFIQLEPSECRGKMNLRLVDRLFATHPYTLYFKRNTQFETWVNSYPSLDWRIEGIFPEAYLFA